MSSPSISLRCGKYCLPEITAIIFDKDGTLADSHSLLERLARLRARLCVQAIQAKVDGSTEVWFQALLDCFGVTPAGLNPEGLMAVGTRQANRHAAAIALAQAGYPVDRLQTLVEDCFAAADRALTPKAFYTPPFTGTQALLQRLGESPIPLAVLSSDSTVQVIDFLAHYGLLPWVQIGLGTEPDDPPKPKPDLLYRLCDRLGVDVTRVVMVGDSEVDRDLAHNAGAAGFISVSEAWGRPPVAGASLVLRTWDDLAIIGS